MFKARIYASVQKECSLTFETRMMPFDALLMYLEGFQEGSCWNGPEFCGRIEIISIPESL